MSRVSAMIAEDEPLMRAQLRDALAALWPELAIVAEAGDGNSALAEFERHRPQLCFLDIRMPGKTGLEVAAAIGGACHIVFITAYDEYALSAFDAGAADYLLKPVEAERLSLAIERIKRKLGSAPADMSGLLAQLKSALDPHGEKLRWIKAAVGRQVKLIAVSDVVYFQADTKYTRVVLAGSETLIRTPLKELLEQLDPDRFWQVHRGTIVNVDAVQAVFREDAEKQFLLLKGRPERLPVSRQFFHLFKQM